LFQARILEEYDKMVDTDNFVVLDGTLPVNKLQKQMRRHRGFKIDLKRFAPHVPEPDDHARPGKRKNGNCESPCGNFHTHITPAAPTAAKTTAPTEDASSQYFFGEPLVGFDPSEITGNLIVIEGWTDRDDRRRLRCCRVAESEGFAVQTSGLRVRIWWDATSMNFWPRTPRRG